MRICTTANPKTNHANHWTIPVLCFHPLRTCMQKLHIHLILYMMVCLVHRMIALYIIVLCTIFWMRIAAHIAKKGDQRFGCIEQGPSTLYMSNIEKKTSKMYRRGWENKQNARRLYAMSGGNGCTKDLWSPHHRGRLVWTHPESKVSCACCTGSMFKKKQQPTINATLTISPRPCIAHPKSYFGLPNWTKD